MDHAEVVIVGGGPAGCSAGVFTARFGLDTVVFDRGKAALPRSAYLANYPGFPAGIDIETFRDLLHDHAREAGCRLVEEMVVSVRDWLSADPSSEADVPARFVVETQDGSELLAERVIAAAWYDGGYLHPLTGDDAFETVVHHSEEHEQFDRGYADTDGRTPVDGLYVAAPNDGRNAQAITSAGQGAHVARSLLQDVRRAKGYAGDVLTARFDWLRPEAEFTGEWAERDRWRDWFGNELPDDHGLDAGELRRLREEYIDRAFETRLTDAEIDQRTERGHRRLLDHLDDELILDYASKIRAGWPDPEPLEERGDE
jgi:2-polyprenyl-6-methoxyphenol hydroxylase-like FAD-dependent oxidoreductase